MRINEKKIVETFVESLPLLDQSLLTDSILKRLGSCAINYTIKTRRYPKRANFIAWFNSITGRSREGYRGVPIKISNRLPD